MTQCLLKSIIRFLDMENYEYIHIKVKGLGFVIKYLSREEAENLIYEEDLEFYQSYPKLGIVYDDGKFRNYVNKHPKLKKFIIKSLNKIENES